MSAESPRKPGRQGGHIVAPQPVSDRSIIESVAGFINDVVPQGYTSSPLCENKEQITWARFEYADINDPALYPDTTDDRNGTAPLLLVLGYGNGVQVWAIPASGEATEVLSWRQGVVRTLRVLPSPTATVPDTFAHKRPLVALSDSSSPGPQFCSLSFISLRAGDQVKSIKFKNPVNDVLANGRSIVVSFSERIAVFDASTLEDRLTITTCYPCPGPNPNPVALGPRWLAYAERRLIPSKRCSGGTEGEGIHSYTATVLHAAKSLGKGLRELGETVASSLTGGLTPPGARPAGFTATGQTDSAEVLHPGIVTIVDAQGTWKENGRMEDNVIAHFTAHAEAIVALQFDPSGILLVTADKRGHDFHLFRIQPHPGGSSLAAVHHLYVLHRGDTTAKVQDIAFASDSRWVAVSTLRGTTHVFPVTPYGGAVGLRTHSTPHVVNRLSRFHRSAGLTGDGRNSPQPQAPEAQLVTQAMPYPNPRLPPYPHPTVVAPLAQIRQPVMHLSTPGSPNPSNAYHRNPSVRTLGRNQSSSEDSGGIPLRVSSCFAPSRAWLVSSPTVQRDSSNRNLKRAVDSLFVMACHGNLIEYDLETKHAAGIPKEKVCDDTPIELEVQAKAQWLLLRPTQSCEVQPPLSGMNPLMVPPSPLPYRPPAVGDNSDERWLSHVEIITHAGPHRRLWMGPQFTFKTYTVPTGGLSSVAESEGIDIGSRLTRSNPVNMPTSSAARPVVPFLIESGSGGSYEQSPRLVEVYGGSNDSDGSAGRGETQLREELADAMMESPGVPTRDTGRRVIVELQGGRRSQTIPIEKIVNPVGKVLTVFTDEGCADSKTIDGECMESAVRWPTDVIKIMPPASQMQPGKKQEKVSDVSVSSPVLEVEVSKKQSKSQSGVKVLKCREKKNVAVDADQPNLIKYNNETERSTIGETCAVGGDDLVKKTRLIGGSKSKENSAIVDDVKKAETDVCASMVDDKDRRKKAKDVHRDKSSEKNTESLTGKMRNQKKMKPITVEMMEDISENIPKIPYLGLSSKCDDDDGGNFEDISHSTLSSSLLETSEPTDVLAMSKEEENVFEVEHVPCDGDTRSDEQRSESSVLEPGIVAENESEDECQRELIVPPESKPSMLGNMATSVQAERDESPDQTSGPFQRSIELPSKLTIGAEESSPLRGSSDKTAIVLSSVEVTADLEQDTAVPVDIESKQDFAPIPVQRRKYKSKNVASRMNSDVVLGSEPKSEKTMKIPVKVDDELDKVESLPTVPVEDSNCFVPIPEIVQEQSTDDYPSKIKAGEMTEEKASRGSSQSKEVLKQPKNRTTVVETEIVTVKSSLGRKPKKIDSLPKVTKCIETELCASQSFEEPLPVESVDTDEANQTAALDVDVEARKYQGLHVEEITVVQPVEEITVVQPVETVSRVGYKRVSRTKFKPFDVQKDVKYVALKPDVDHSPNRRSDQVVDDQGSSEETHKTTIKPTAVKESAKPDAPDDQLKELMKIEDIEKKSSLSGLTNIRLSPPKLWSSIASSKQSKPCDADVLLTPTLNTWNTITADDPCDEIAEPTLEDESPFNGVDEEITINKSSIEQFSGVDTVVSSVSDTPTLLQANKKNNKKKNKKRR